MTRRSKRSESRGFSRWFALGLALGWGVIAWLGWPSVAQAGPLLDRVNAFPYWVTKPPTKPAAGDLIYPPWMAGDWQATSTLLELSAPFAPEIVTPGFESNRSLLGQPVSFAVRFGPQTIAPALSAFPLRKYQPPDRAPIVADRAFNGLNIAAAYLGRRAIAGVVADPGNPNEQILKLANQRALVSTVTDRASETPSDRRFLATEVIVQSFQNEGTQQGRSVYANAVETTTDYRRTAPDAIEADQFTAVYLAPRDRYASVTRNRPVALSHYRLTLQAIAPEANPPP